MVIIGEGSVSYERGTPVPFPDAAPPPPAPSDFRPSDFRPCAFRRGAVAGAVDADTSACHHPSRSVNGRSLLANRLCRPWAQLTREVTLQPPPLTVGLNGPFWISDSPGQRFENAFLYLTRPLSWTRRRRRGHLRLPPTGERLVQSFANTTTSRQRGR